MAKLDIRSLVPGTETNGAVSVFEEVVQPGVGPPLHTHREQTEIFHVISGTILFEVNGQRMKVAAGDVAVVPAGSVHAFRNVGEKPATIHFDLIPSANSDEAFRRLVTEEIADPGAFFDQYGMELVGPPMEADD